jgi:para-nitrobenzyl esterase
MVVVTVNHRLGITGQSGGGGKCSHLMAMPSARGLFHKVAIQYGSTLKTGRHEDRQKDAERLCTKLGVATGELAKLQSVAFRDIVDNQANAGRCLTAMWCRAIRSIRMRRRYRRVYR